MTHNRWKFKGWTVCGIALAQVNRVRADSDRVFELRVYHAVPAKVPALETRFRDAASKLRTDPDFLELAKSEQTDKLVEKVDSAYLHPTDFSPMK